MQNGRLPLAELEENPDEGAGFRLHRLEVYNWGTFHQHVWTLKPDGHNTLLTGDIGSGKSTLVDAITTLLVPAQRITYNKAAGAESKERNLRSYVLGYYKLGRTDAGFGAKPLALRDYNSYSVVLAHFRCEGLGQDVTLAQVYWLQDNQGQPARFYLVAERPMTIAHDFAGFGSDIADLRKRLKGARHVHIYDHFPPYAADFRRRFGIESDQALELFNQTVSMKSVGNLTEFVRTHMLEAFGVEGRIEALTRHFDDLDRAHQAVLKAKQQIEALTPLVDDATRHAEIAAGVERLRRCRDALRPWFASLKLELLDRRLELLGQELERLAARVEALEGERREQDLTRDELRQAIAENGGDRLERIGHEIDELSTDLKKRRRRDDEYQALTTALGFDQISDEDGFLANRRMAESARAALEDRQTEVENARIDAEVRLREVRDQHKAVEEELASLRSRRSNVPGHMVQLRAKLCDALGAPEAELPFAGELIQVREEASAWEGAAERLLHNFGLSLLVPDRYYAAVSDWVDRTHLRGRLVYYRVRAPRSAGSSSLHPNSLVRKLAIQIDSEFYPWLDGELARRFDYACCDEMEQFRREVHAVTRAGQIKGSGERHEKDDRFAIGDRSRYVLGWSNEAKIAALEKQLVDLVQRIQAAGQAVATVQKEQARLRERDRQLTRLHGFRDFAELDWRPLPGRIEQLDEERRRLEATSDRLRVLREQLQSLEAKIKETDQTLNAARDERAKREERREEAQRRRAEASEQLAEAPEAVRAGVFPSLEAMRTEALGQHTLTVESCDNRQGEMRVWLQATMDAEGKRLERLQMRIIDAMRRFSHAWPLETREFDVSLEAAGEYSSLLERLTADDLPRFESRFKELLRENTIREVAGFHAQLNRERETISERVDTINRSLRAIDYNKGRYILLEPELTGDVEVREFREALRACTEGALTGSEDDQYSESKFLQVKAIIERFRGREGSAEIDKRWTRKVTDVRHWFVFSASERWREDDAEHEHYTDSGGKSGGQKEKLAYTVLAASLAYQFGLERAGRQARSFRFVVIDEAFGRGSDESAHYGLELFRRLNLQVLIVTPLQKIHVIEPFVASVAFVHNEDDRQSKVRNLSIEEYRAERAARSLIRVE